MMVITIYDGLYMTPSIKMTTGMFYTTSAVGWESYILLHIYISVMARFLLYL